MLRDRGRSTGTPNHYAIAFRQVTEHEKRARHKEFVARRRICQILAAIVNLIADKSLICYPPADMLRTIPVMLLCLSTTGCFGPDNAFRAPIEYSHYWLVTGEILDAQTDEPVVEADVVVTLLRGGEQIGEESTRTDSTGRFGVISDQGRTFRTFDFFGGNPPEPIGPPPDVILLRIVTANGEITEMIAVSEEMIRPNTALGVTISGTISLPP